MNEGKGLIIEPTVAEQPDAVQTFQWYQDGKKLEGRIGKTLEIKDAYVSHGGKYTLTVTTTVDTVSAQAQSSECELTVIPCPHPETEIRGQKDPTMEEPGYTGDTVCTTCGHVLQQGEEIPALGGGGGDRPSFVDVAEGAFYYDAVAWAVENGITSGTTATKFSPNSPANRAQMVTFLWRAAGSPKAPGSNPFQDVPEKAYYHDAVLWAVEKGITLGTSETTFSPEEKVTRGQAVAFLYRANGAPPASGGSFADVPADAYYADAVVWAVENGITLGTGKNKFSPKSKCTRGQVVTFLYRDAQEVSE